MPPAAFLHPQNAPKSLAAPQTPLWELTALPRPPSWIKGASFKGKGKGGSGREANRRKEEGKGVEGRDFGPSQFWKQMTPLIETRSKIAFSTVYANANTPNNNNNNNNQCIKLRSNSTMQ